MQIPQEDRWDELECWGQGGSFGGSLSLKIIEDAWSKSMERLLPKKINMYYVQCGTLIMFIVFD